MANFLFILGVIFAISIFVGVVVIIFANTKPFKKPFDEPSLPTDVIPQHVHDQIAADKKNREVRKKKDISLDNLADDCSRDDFMKGMKFWSKTLEKALDERYEPYPGVKYNFARYKVEFNKFWWNGDEYKFYVAYSQDKRRMSKKDWIKVDGLAIPKKHKRRQVLAAVRGEVDREYFREYVENE